ncbi:MAG: 16S rRNA (adenine(1518)-N(6)/adenine(1519)-N(6))-dimethyltransferase RsmA [Candidatus Moranbacteria bacterium]|nr:16S rRNA (adenine(1518)-N(6)/adenine(1519)-N(6))-dimethyltransferase RsmA [Candidatus Moranbacteria bacterium]
MQVKAKKHLGQNFLKDEGVLGRIVASANIAPDDFVVEIGPGTGILTQVLSEKAKRVISLELDSDLIPNLLKRFPLSSNVTIVRQDILQADLMEVLKKSQLPEGQSYKVVANIPYYITAPIIQYLLELPMPPECIVLMVQKEVAERITAKVGALSILAVSVQYYADAELSFIVPKTAFEPVPQVDSAVVRLVPKRSFDKDLDKKFFRCVKAGFSSRRKTLVNNFSASFHLPKDAVAQKLDRLGLDANIRAQALAIDDWQRVATAFE